MSETSQRKGRQEGKGKKDVPQKKPELKRQNSGTLRKYRDVYEGVQKEQNEKSLSDRLEKLTTKEKNPPGKTKKERKKTAAEVKPKRQLNSYQLFFKEKRLAGKTPSEIGVLWKAQKEKEK